MQVYIALAILVITIILFATEVFKPAVTAISASVAMVLFGINSPSDLTAGFSNTVTIFCFGLAVVGASLTETGCLGYLGNKLVVLSRFSERTVLVILLAVAAIASMFLSNTSVVIIFMSIANILAGTANGKYKIKNLYMGIGVASVVGGGCSLIGSTTQLGINAILPDYGVESLKMWDLLGPGIPVVILMLVWYYFFGYNIQQKIFDFDDVVVEATAEQKAELKVGNPKSIKMWIPLIVLVGCIALTIQGMNIAVCGLLGAMLVCIFNCISVKRMWEVTDWNTLGVIAGAVGFAAGIDNSGAGALIAEKCIQVVGENASPVFYLAIFVTLAAVMTNVMQNISTAIILTPIAISIANTLGFDPMALIIGVLWGANMPYSTPVGASVMTMTMQAGYRFVDYTKVNIVFNVLAVIAVVVTTPFFFPMS